MACNCVDIIEDELCQRLESDPKNKAINIRINKTLVINLKDSKKPILTYLYNKQLKDGSSSAKLYEGNILPTYCPFCGIKYE